MRKTLFQIQSNSLVLGEYGDKIEALKALKEAPFGVLREVFEAPLKGIPDTLFIKEWQDQMTTALKEFENKLKEVYVGRVVSYHNLVTEEEHEPELINGLVISFYTEQDLEDERIDMGVAMDVSLFYGDGVECMLIALKDMQYISFED